MFDLFHVTGNSPHTLRDRHALPCTVSTVSPASTERRSFPATGHARWGIASPASWAARFGTREGTA